MATWASLTICEKADVARLRPSLSDALDAYWVDSVDDDDGIGTHELAKQWLEDNLNTRFESDQLAHQAIEGSDYDLLDHIDNPTVLKQTAIAWIIANLLENMALSYEDVHARNAHEAWKDCERKFERAVELLRFDDDDDVHDPILGEIEFVR